LDGPSKYLLEHDVDCKALTDHQANAFNLSYSDAGLFGLYAEAQQGHAGAALEAVFSALKSVKDRRPTDEEVAKGRALLKVRDTC
jgi:predicted Zn-dependent peptidase